MNDCPNAEIRDRLPDLLHERLDPNARAHVVAHVDTCGDCRAEFDLLRRANAVLAAGTPRVDVAGIVAMLPSPLNAMRPRRTWADWRIAAAVTVIAVGGGSAVVLSHGAPSAAVAGIASTPVATAAATTMQPSVDTTIAQPRTVAAAVPAATPHERPSTASSSVRSASDAQGLEMAGRLGDLSDEQLDALLGEISTMEAVPLTEPEPVDVPIGSQAATAGDEGIL